MDGIESPTPADATPPSPQEGPPPASASPPAESLGLVVDGLRWGLAALLVIQLFVGALAPSLFDVVVGIVASRRSGVCAGACGMMPAALLPWIVFGAYAVTQSRVLRRLGGLPYSDAQVLAMALLPGYNLQGTVELFTAQGEALERLGGGRGLGIELRALAAVASGLSVLVYLVALRAYAPFLAAVGAGWREAITPPVGDVAGLVLAGVVLLLVRLLVLARLQMATRKALDAARGSLAAGDAPLPSDVRRYDGLPGVRTALLATGLAVGAAGFIVVSARARAAPEIAERAEFERQLAAIERGDPTYPWPPSRRPPPIERPREASVAGPSPAAPPRQEPPDDPTRLPAGFLFAGRTVEWWQARLVELRARTDDEGLRLFDQTRERAKANGLGVAVDGQVVRVVPTPEAIAAARRGDVP